MNPTRQSTVGMARRGAGATSARYLEQMTAAEEHRKRAFAGQAKMAKGRKIEKEGQDEFAAALLDLFETGLSGGQLAREFELSETHIRNTIKLERLRRAATN